MTTTPQLTPDPQTGYYTLPALGGEDVSRHRTEILVQIDAYGAPRNPAHHDKRWTIVGATVLMGWGDLDGDAYTVSCGAAWTVDVRATDWERLRDLAGEDIAASDAQG